MHISILFWLLIALLAVLIFAIEAGVTAKHRQVVLCSIFSTMMTVLYIMFMVDDKTFFPTAPYEEQAKKKKKGKPVEIEFDKKPEGEAADATLKQKDGAGTAEEGGTPGPDAELEQKFSECEKCPVMTRMPKGKFRMGARPQDPVQRQPELPMVDIDFGREFAVSSSEITREEFAAFVKESGYQPAKGCMINGKRNPKAHWMAVGFEQSSLHPVVCVSYDDAQAYVSWLSKRAKKAYRLLSEAEWEYMARGDTETAYSSGDVMSTAHANFNRSRDGTIPAGFSGSNGFGVFDVHGNAAEMVEGCWSNDLTVVPKDGRSIERNELFAPGKGAPQSAGTPAHEPVSNVLANGEIVCRRGVTRGGGWDSKAPDVRSAARGIMDSTQIGTNSVGFRVARDVEPGSAPKSKPADSTGTADAGKALGEAMGEAKKK